MKMLQEFLEDDYEDYIENVEKSYYVLGSELWESKSMDCLPWLRNIL